MKQKFLSNLLNLRGRITEACESSIHDRDDISIVAVTKNNPASAIELAVAEGLLNIGESRVQEAEEKFQQTGKVANFHLIGHLQSNKAKKAVAIFDMIQSLDSLKLAEAINIEAEKIDRKIKCLVQVNCSGEEQKYGIDPKVTLEIVDKLSSFENIELAGLMTMAAFSDDQQVVRNAFKIGYELYNKSQEIAGKKFNILSMGMSSDFEIAIEEGSNMIRVGSILFG